MLLSYFIPGTEEQSWALAKEPESECIPRSDTSRPEGSLKLKHINVFNRNTFEWNWWANHPSHSAQCQFTTGWQKELICFWTSHNIFLCWSKPKKEPSECWKLCTLIWERLIKFCMFMASTSLQDIFPWWYSASDYLPTQTRICSRGQYTGNSAGSLQGGKEWSVFGPTLENVLFSYQYESVCRGLNRHADPQSDCFLLS